MLRLRFFHMSSDRVIVDAIKVAQDLLRQNLPPARNLTDAAVVLRFRELVRCVYRDPRPLASSRLPSVLAMGIPLSWRPTEDRWGTARADPPDERRKSAMGCAAHSWRAAQARLRGRSVQRGEVHGQAMWTAVPGL